MRVTIFNDKCLNFEHIEIGNSGLKYLDNKNDKLYADKISIHIDNNNRYVDINAEQFKIIRISNNMNTWLKLERLDGNDLPLPQKATSGAAGIDFAACLTRPCQRWEEGVRTSFNPDDELFIMPGEQIGISLGFKAELNNNYALLLYLRSSSGIKGLMLSNLVGVIDSDYRGELFAIICNRTDKYIKINHGDRIVQGIVTHIHDVLVTEGKVDVTTRGEGGLGSTGS